MDSPPVWLRLAGYGGYLAAWAVVGVATLLSSLPVRRVRDAEPGQTGREAIGLAMQALAVVLVTAGVPGGALRASSWALLGSATVAPASAVLFAAAQWEGCRRRASGLVRSGAYGLVRHPVYVAMLGMVVSTGLVAGSAAWTVMAAVTFLAGTELRVRGEEASLAGRFAGEHRAYCRAVRWRYLWGVR